MVIVCLPLVLFCCIVAVWYMRALAARDCELIGWCAYALPLIHWPWVANAWPWVADACVFCYKAVFV